MNTIFLWFFLSPNNMKRIATVVFKHMRVTEHFVSERGGWLFWNNVKMDKSFTLNIDDYRQSKYSRHTIHLKRYINVNYKLDN